MNDSRDDLRDGLAAETAGAPPNAWSAPRIALRTALNLLLFTLVFTALMAGSYQLTAPLLAASALEQKRRLIAEVLPPTQYDNDLLNDAVLLAPTSALNIELETRIYRARKDGEPVALVFESASNDGYSGRIELLNAVSADQRLLAVRVTLHKETPGLGDYIDPAKDRNKTRPWISQFSALGFTQVPESAWRVKKDGGVFDQMSGATISARAVTNASRRALQWASRHQAAIFALPSGARYSDTGANP
jgi:electron transport complex protein RnfG